MGLSPLQPSGESGWPIFSLTGSPSHQLEQDSKILEVSECLWDCRNLNSSPQKARIYWESFVFKKLNQDSGDERLVILVRRVDGEALILGVRTPQKNKSLANKVNFPCLPSPAARDERNETLGGTSSLHAPPHLGTWRLKSETAQLSIDPLGSWVILGCINRCT